MEKIIAVVIMVVIVIGLIATVVMPQSSQVSNMGGEASGQMSNISSTMGGGAGTTEVTGTQAISEIPQLISNASTYVAFFNTATPQLTLEPTTTGIGVFLNNPTGVTVLFGEATLATDVLWTSSKAGNGSGLATSVTTITPTATGVYRRIAVTAKNISGSATNTFVLFVRK